jgi:hypothetical protein
VEHGGGESLVVGVLEFTDRVVIGLLDDAIKGNTEDDLGVYISSEATAKNDLRNEKKGLMQP